MKVLFIKKYSSTKHKRSNREPGSAVIPEVFINKYSERESRRRKALYIKAFREIQLQAAEAGGKLESKWYEKIFDFGSGI